MDATGKVGRKNALKPGNFGVRRLCKRCASVGGSGSVWGQTFFLASRKSLRKTVIPNQEYLSRQQLLFRRRSIVMFLSRRAFALSVLLCLSLALLFTGCSTDGDGGGGVGLSSDLIGRWASTGSWGTDGYSIDTKKASYFYDDSTMYAGTIRHVENFTDSAGVIIIEYDKEYDNPDGNFIGIYFKNLTPGVSVQMGIATLYPATTEEATLNAAVAAFTLGNEGKYMSYYGLYLAD